jgi:hypothetical protein
VPNAADIPVILDVAVGLSNQGFYPTGTGLSGVINAVGLLGGE